jgi:hypothetical protein
LETAALQQLFYSSNIFAQIFSFKLIHERKNNGAVA